MRKALLIVALQLVASSLLATDGSIAVSPAVIMLKGSPGQSTTVSIKLTNGTSQELSFSMVASDVVVKAKKRVFVPAGETPSSIAATAVFSKDQVTVAPNQSVSVDVTMTVPEGIRHRAVLVTFQATSRVTSAGTAMLASIGTLVTIELSGNHDLEVAAPIIATQTPGRNLLVSELCLNSGTEPFVARGVVAVLDPAGVLVGRFDLQPRRLLPGEEGVLSAEYPGMLSPGRYDVVITTIADSQARTSRSEVVVE